VTGKVHAGSNACISRRRLGEGWIEEPKTEMERCLERIFLSAVKRNLGPGQKNL
jgi:hypothetical protein